MFCSPAKSGPTVVKLAPLIAVSTSKRVNVGSVPRVSTAARAVVEVPSTVVASAEPSAVTAGTAAEG